ncbi:MAG: N-acetyl-gamma-glutamyl-phosphate reductase [Aquisalinus sp.]|nr:N-acetyl-gamma-glutamyl-phosphate reductase [Aquisalinus sp.]
MTQRYSIGLIGARGHTGRELLKLIDKHPNLDLIFAASRELAGKDVNEIAPAPDGLKFENSTPAALAYHNPDICILALPNGASQPFVEVFSEASPKTILIDLSADHRFDPAWAYGLPELYIGSQSLKGAHRIANPGCYATAAQLAIYPCLQHLASPPSVFGVSGYSGAGTNPSPKNDVERLSGNLMPYAPVGHIHEREISHHLGHDVRFTPHVHPAFSGILVTVHMAFKTPLSVEKMRTLYDKTYANHDLVAVQTEIPELRDATGIPGAIIGGFSISEDGLHGVAFAAEDNLLKGAAVQAIQNINLALHLDVLSGIKRA